MRFFRKQWIHKIEKLISPSPEQQSDELSLDVSANEELLKREFEKCPDVQFRSIPLDEKNKILFVYIDGFCDTKLFDEV